MKKKDLHSIGVWLIGLSVIGLVSPFVSRLLSASEGALPWLVDVAADFQLFYQIGLSIGVVSAALQNWKYLGYLPFLLLPLFSAHASAPEGAESGESLKIITANIHFNNDDLSSLLKLIQTEKPDFIALQEVNHSHINDLVGLEDYIFRQILPDDSPFGMAVLSKWPFAEVTTDFNWPGSRLKIPTIEVIVDWRGQLIKLVSFHPMPPIAAEYHPIRHRKLTEIVTESQDSGLPTVIAGDFNATPWSSEFTGVDYKRATGIEPTWVSRYLGLPLDQVLVSEHWLRAKAEVGPDVGSDHLPVVVTISLSAN